MKTTLQTAALCLIAGVLIAVQSFPDTDLFAKSDASDGSAASDHLINAQPKLVRISGTVDGSGRIIFAGSKVHYQHKHWEKPTHVQFDGEPWVNLQDTPPAWSDYSARLDLTKAWIVKRSGRDLIALEGTPDGFDVYLNDSPNGTAHYEVVIAIPRRN